MTTGTVLWSDQVNRSINVGGGSPTTSDIFTLPTGMNLSTGPVVVMAYATWDSGATTQTGGGFSSMAWGLRDTNSTVHDFTAGNPGPGDQLLHTADTGVTFIFGGSGFVVFEPAASFAAFDRTLLNGATLQVAAKARSSSVSANLCIVAALIDNAGVNMSIVRPINSQTNGSSGSFSTVPSGGQQRNDFVAYGGGLSSGLVDGAPSATTPSWAGAPDWADVSNLHNGMAWAGIGMVTNVDSPTQDYSFSTTPIKVGSNFVGQYVVDTFTSAVTGGYSFGVVIG